MWSQLCYSLKSINCSWPSTPSPVTQAKTSITSPWRLLGSPAHFLLTNFGFAEEKQNLKVEPEACESCFKRKRSLEAWRNDHSCHPAFASHVVTGVPSGLSTHRKRGLFGIKLSHRHEGLGCRHLISRHRTEMTMFPALSLLIVKFWNMGLDLLWG